MSLFPRQFAASMPPFNTHLSVRQFLLVWLGQQPHHLCGHLTQSWYAIHSSIAFTPKSVGFLIPAVPPRLITLQWINPVFVRYPNHEAIAALKVFDIIFDTQQTHSFDLQSNLSRNIAQTVQNPLFTQQNREIIAALRFNDVSVHKRSDWSWANTILFPYSIVPMRPRGQTAHHNWNNQRTCPCTTQWWVWLCDHFWYIL